MTFDLSGIIKRGMKITFKYSIQNKQAYELELQSISLSLIVGKIIFLSISVLSLYVSQWTFILLNEGPNTAHDVILREKKKCWLNVLQGINLFPTNMHTYSQIRPNN
jgi:hypothetical protein